MEENRSVFDYISKVFTVFGVVVLIHVIIGSVVGKCDQMVTVIGRIAGEIHPLEAV